MKKKRRGILFAAILLLLMTAAFFLYTADCSRADGRALAALASDAVRVEKTDYGWFFDGPSEERALIFYPGGKVEETAYAPLLHALAERGVDVCLLRVPFHLAFFAVNAADVPMARYDYESWYVGGHSLGGVAAASYAAAHELDGLILLASYPTRAVDEPILLLYGSEDGVLNRERVAAAGQYGAVEAHVIEGGNHARFGDYGEQKGDLPAAIGAGEQQRRTVDAIMSWLAGSGGDAA